MGSGTRIAGRPATVSSAMVEAPARRDDEMRPGELVRHVGDVGGEIGGNAERGVAGAHAFDILGAALLGDLQPAAEMFGKQAEPFGHDLREDGRALAAAGDEQPEDAVVGQRRIGLVAKRQHLVAHRIADQMGLALAAFGEPLDVRIGGGDRVDPARDDPVDPAEHRILLVDQGRDPVALRRHQRGQRRIAAEADHRRRLERLVEPRGHRPAGEDLADRAEPADRPAAQPAGGEDMDRHALEQPGDARAAIVGDQRDAMAAPHQLLGQRMGGDHVPAGAAGGEDVVAAQHVPVTPAQAGASGRPAETSRPGSRLSPG